MKPPPSDVIPFDEDEVWEEEEWRDIAMSWDGSAFCTARTNGLVTVLDVASGKQVKQTEMPPLQEKKDIPVGRHLPLAVSRNGQMLATALKDESIRLWNVTKDELFTVNSAVRTRVVSLEFSPAGDALFILRVDGQLEKVPMGTAQADEVLPPQADTRPHSISFSDDGSRVAIGQLDGRVSIWKFAAGRLVSEWQWRPHFEIVDRVVYFSDGHTVATCGRDGTIKFWDVSARIELQGVDPDRDAFFSLALSKDGTRLAAGTTRGQIKLWDVKSRRQVATLEAGRVNVTYRLTFSDENTLACLVKEKGVKIFRATSWKQIKAEEPGAARRK